MRKRMGIYTSFLWVQCRALALATCHSATCACNTLIFGGLLPGDHMASTPSRSHSENAMISVLPEIILCRSRLSEERIGSPSFRDGVALPTGCCVRYESEQIQNRSLPPDPPPSATTRHFLPSFAPLPENGDTLGFLEEVSGSSPPPGPSAVNAAAAALAGSSFSS